MSEEKDTKQKLSAKEAEQVRMMQMQKLLSRIAPSKRYVLTMPIKFLLKHNALIALKSSSLPSMTRRRIQERVFYLVKNGKVSQARVEGEIKLLSEELLQMTSERIQLALGEEMLNATSDDLPEDIKELAKDVKVKVEPVQGAQGS